jgi:hypothetical protein
MSLSKDEQRALDEIERTFRDDDPKFAGNFAFARLERRQRIIGYAAFVFGVTVLLVGAMVTQVQTAAGVIVSLGGFLVMYVAACWIFRDHYPH